MKLVIPKETIRILAAMSDAGNKDAKEKLERYNSMRIEERKDCYILTERDAEDQH